MTLSSAHHDPSGRFRNPWPQSQPHGGRDVLKWMLSRKRRSAGEPPQMSLSHFDPSADTSRISITWIGHSTFLLQSNGVSVLTDPIWSDRASPVQFAGPHRYVAPAIRFDDLPRIDAIFISHDHYDHLDRNTVKRLIEKFPLAKWIAPLGVDDFLNQNGAAHVIAKDWWQSVELGVMSAFSTPAQHFSGRYPWNRNATLWCGWVISIRDHRVFFAGDTGLHPEFEEIARRLGPIDAAILPIGAYEPRWFMQPVHMNPEDAVSAYRALSAGNVHSRDCVFIPSHWGTFRLTDEPLDEPPQRLRAAWMNVELPEDQLRVLQPGETVERS